jgi:hypothetical protein
LVRNIRVPLGFFTVKVKVKVKAAVSRLYDTDARRHIVSLPLTEFTPSSPESAAYQAGMSALASEGANYMY